MFRVRVPLDVQPHFGVKEVFRSLGTRQPGAAKRERDRLLEEYRNAFEAARSLPPPEEYRAVMTRYGLRSDAVTREDIDRLKAALKMEADIAAEADAAYEAHLEEQHREAREWVDSLSDSEIDALRRRALYNHRAPMLEGQAARPIGAFAADGIVVPDEAALEIDVLEGKAAPKQPEKPSGKFTICDALEHYLAHNDDIAPKTENEWRRIIDLFVQCHGNTDINDITKIMISEFILYRKGINTNRGTPPSLATINKDIAAIRSVLQCCVKSGYIQSNPASGFTKKVKTHTTKRLPLLISEIERIEIEETDRDFWIWKILVYTGARLGEIAQLHKKDVVKVGSVWSLTLHLEEGGHLKNEPSIRRVPIHKEILKPFMNWLNTRPSGPLWPDCWKKGGEAIVSSSGAVSQRLNRRLRGAGILDKKKTAHSLRHTFKYILRHVCGDEEIRDSLQGHAGHGGVGRDYGNGHYMRKLQSVVDRIDLAEIKREQLIDSGEWQLEIDDDQID